MTNKKTTKKALLSSILSLVICLTMLIGTTFAWFTDSVTSGNNKIQAGNLDVALEYQNLENGSWGEVQTVDKNTDPIFNYQLWEPGYTEAKLVSVVNKGALALKYLINIVPEGDAGILANVIDVYYAEITEDTVEAYTSFEAAKAAGIVKIGTLSQVIDGSIAMAGDLLKGETDKVCIMLHMQESAGNEYQGESIGTSFDINLVATQYTYENDSFNNQYDAAASYPWSGAADISWYNDTDTTFALAKPEELAGLAELVNNGNNFSKKTITLADDMDLANREWTPIGTSGKPFSGTFDGNGHTVSNLSITGYTSNVGLFGYTTNGEIKSLTVKNANVSGRLNVGAVSGTPYTSKYTNITLTGDVVVKGMSYVGGVAGKNVYADWTDITVDVNEGSYVLANSVENGTAYRTYVGGVVGFVAEGSHKLTNVTSNIDVYGSTCDIGGIAGIAHYGTSFINCKSSGDVTVTDALEAGDAEEMGGIAGVWHNQAGYTVTFENCVYTGTLKANIEGVDLSDNTIVGAPYSSTGTGQLIITNN